MKLFVIKKKNQNSRNEKKKVYLGTGYNLCSVSNIAIKRINTIF